MTTTHSLHHIPHDERPSDRRDATRADASSRISSLWLRIQSLLTNPSTASPARVSSSPARVFATNTPRPRRSHPSRVPPPRRSIAKSISSLRTLRTVYQYVPAQNVNSAPAMATFPPHRARCRSLNAISERTRRARSVDASTRARDGSRSDVRETRARGKHTSLDAAGARRGASRRARGRQREKELFSRDASSARRSRDASEVRHAHIHPRRRARDREFASGVTTPHAAPVRRCLGVDVDWFTYYVMVS